MADTKPKASIPAWQQRSQQQPTTTKTDDNVKVEGTGTPATEDAPNATESGLPAPVPAEPAAEEAASTDATIASQLENMKTFLEDPAVKAAPLEKKRAFFLSKGIASDLIDQVLKSEDSAFSATDFESFKQNEAQAVQPSTQPPPAPQSQAQTAPPIITYPEFLVEAHKPPPLITPGRIINTAYIAGTLYALLYGASKYLVQPMSLSLSDARHEFSQHSQSKLDEMNERLEKLVSKLPTPKAGAVVAEKEMEDEDVESETSDPTELYHRDIGVQTSPLPSRRPSSSFSSLPGFDSQGTNQKKDPLTHSMTVLGILQSHLDEMLSRAESLEQPNKERQESVNKLRTQLDNMMFAHPSSYGMWAPSPTYGDMDAGAKKEDEKEDVIEEVKKEIRGVKGVLLSAKRFPGVAGRVGG